MKPLMVLITVFCLGTPMASAAPTLIVGLGGKLFGANNVEVGGSLYDVQFLDGSCIGVFSGCDDLTDFTFPAAIPAQQAATALSTMVFVDSTEGAFDSDPSLTIGCVAPTTFCGVLIPYQLSSPPFNVVRFGNSTVNDVVSLVDIASTSINTNVSIGLTWARFTPAAPVPTPSAFLLMSTGLVGLILFRRRQDRSQHTYN